MLYEDNMQGEPIGKLSSGDKIIVYENAKSKNTSSVYAYVEILNGEFQWTSAWISLSSNNLEIYKSDSLCLEEEENN